MCSCQKTFGIRSQSVSDFQREISDFESVSTDTAASLFHASGGRSRLAREVIHGAHAARLDINSLDFTEYVDLVLPDEDSENVFSTTALRLLQISAVLPTMDRGMLQLALRAATLNGSDSAGQLLSVDELISHLVVEGLIEFSPERHGHFILPPLVRSRCLRSSDHRRDLTFALGQTLEEHHRALIEDGSLNVGSVLTLASTLELWPIMRELWAERGFSLFTTDLTSVCESFLAIPTSALAASPILAEGHSAAREVSENSRRKGSSEPRIVLSSVTFEYLDVPTLEKYCAQVLDGERTIDDIVAATLSTMRRCRQNSDTSGAIEAGHRGARLIADKESTGRSSTRMYEARFSLERAIDLADSGELGQATHLLRRSVLIAESALPLSPYPVLKGYASSALVSAIAGQGADSERHLNRYDQLRTQLNFSTRASETGAISAEFVRAVEQLHLSHAEELRQRLDSLPFDGVSAGAIAYFSAVLDLCNGQALRHIHRYGDFLEEAMITGAGDSMPGSVSLSTLTLLHLATGSAKDAQRLVNKATPRSPGYHLARARLALSLRNYDEVASETVFMQAKTQGPIVNGTAHGLKAAVWHRRGFRRETDEQIDSVLDYSAIAGSLLPIALMPSDVRSVLIERNNDDERWGHIAQTFVHPSVTPVELRARLHQLPEAVYDAGINEVVLTSAELRMLYALETSASIATIAKDKKLAVGTVKNMLSRMYKKMGVRNRAQAIEYGYHKGYYPRR